jgi:hypothetical protein
MRGSPSRQPAVRGPRWHSLTDPQQAGEEPKTEPDSGRLGDLHEGNESDIPAWAITKRTSFNEDETASETLIVRNDGDCDPATVIGMAFYLVSRASPVIRQKIADPAYSSTSGPIW